MVNSEQFAERLQQIMNRYDLSASAFAEKIHVGRSSISHILSGRNKPSLDFVLAVLKTFEEVDLYWLLNGRGTFPKSQKNSSVENPPVTAVKKEDSPPSRSVASADADSPTVIKAEIKSTSEISNNGKNISKVILIYDDGTFENFIP
jgi:transcriptional regulator with XRE-family HTH domain